MLAGQQHLPCPNHLGKRLITRITGGALKDQNGPQIQTGVWQIIGGGLIIAAAALFKVIVA